MGAGAPSGKLLVAVSQTWCRWIPSTDGIEVAFPAGDREVKDERDNDRESHH